MTQYDTWSYDWWMGNILLPLFVVGIPFAFMAVVVMWIVTDITKDKRR